MKNSYIRRAGARIYRIIAMMMAALVIASLFPTAALAKSKTGTGMAEWALRAYNEGWRYEYGGSSAGAVDCSGLIRSYTGSGGGAKALLDASSSSGKISSLPRVHGLGLWCDGHAGVYVGKNESGENMAVDARNSKVDVVYSAMNSRNYNPWVKWFKIKGVSYPTTGWETFNGKKYYYYKGEFVTGQFEVDGVTYDFGKSGALKGEAKKTEGKEKTTEAKKKKTTTTAKKTKAANESLKLGMSGDRVTKLQKRLIELGYLDAEATGYYGEKTAKAVKAFQKNASLTADGVAGPATQEKIYSSKAPKYKSETKKATKKKTTTTVKTTTTTEKIISMRMGMEGENVKKLQKRLIELGWLDSEVTGFYGEKTAIAVQKFQRAVKLSDDGVAGRITLEKLYAEGAPSKPTTTTTTRKTTTTTTTTTKKKTTTTTTVATTEKDEDKDKKDKDETEETEETTTKKTTTTTTKKTTEKTTAPTSNTTAETTETTAEPEYVEPTSPDGEPLYEELSFGAQGEAVRAMSRKLSELGYYDHDVSDYFGVFLRIAVMNFQLNAGLGVTGIADPETQEILYSADAPYASETLSDAEIYGDELDMDELDEAESDEQTAPGAENTVSGGDAEEPQLADSAGLGAYSTHSDIVSFIGKYGDSGELQTMGIFSYTPPVITVYRDGESYEVSDELDEALDSCVFY